MDGVLFFKTPFMEYWKKKLDVISKELSQIALDYHSSQLEADIFDNELSILEHLKSMIYMNEYYSNTFCSIALGDHINPSLSRSKILVKLTEQFIKLNGPIHDGSKNESSSEKIELIESFNFNESLAYFKKSCIQLTKLLNQLTPKTSEYIVLKSPTNSLIMYRLRFAFMDLFDTHQWHMEEIRKKLSTFKTTEIG